MTSSTAPAVDVELVELNSMAVERLAGGDGADAVTLLVVLAQRCRTMLGVNHPATLIVEGNLAVARFCEGPEEGMLLLQIAANRRDAVWGSDDPRTLAAQEAHAVGLRLSGRHVQAVRLSEQVCRSRERVLGPAHVDSLTSRMSLGLAHAAAGGVRKAVEVLSAALDDAVGTHGSLHPSSVTIRAGLARCLQEVGLCRSAVRQLERAVSDCSAVLGSDHDETRGLRLELADLHVPTDGETVQRPVR